MITSLIDLIHHVGLSLSADELAQLSSEVPQPDLSYASWSDEITGQISTSVQVNRLYICVQSAIDDHDIYLTFPFPAEAFESAILSIRSINASLVVQSYTYE